MSGKKQANLLLCTWKSKITNKNLLKKRIRQEHPIYIYGYSTCLDPQQKLHTGLQGHQVKAQGSVVPVAVKGQGGSPRLKNYKIIILQLYHFNPKYLSPHAIFFFTKSFFLHNFKIFLIIHLSNRNFTIFNIRSIFKFSHCLQIT